MQFLIDAGLSVIYFCIFLLLCAWVWRFWMMYIQQKHFSELSWIMLEIKLPREINKSPLATEMALASLLQGGGLGNQIALFFKGSLPAYSSLEIASIEGVVHFYIRIQKKFRPLVEANFYAQYPGIEIIEADDYTKQLRYHHLTKDVSMWGINFRTNSSWIPTDDEKGTPYKKKNDKGEDKDYTMKADFLPIKTYVDYGLDKDPKEEFKVDPLTPVLELMGGMGKGEHLWYQILVVDEDIFNDKKFPKFYVNEVSHKHLNLKDMIDLRKKQIRTASWNIKDIVPVDEFGQPKIIDAYRPIGDDGKAYEQLFDESVDKDGKTIKVPRKIQAKFLKTKAVAKKETELTPEEKDELEIINKKISKPLALCFMRVLYVTKRENFNPSHIQDVLSILKPFKGANSFAPMVTTDPYDFDWQNRGKKRSNWRAEEMFEEYVEREGFFPHIKPRPSLDSWEDFFFWSSTMKQRRLFRMMYEAIFYPFEHPHADMAFVLNLEELATMWHLPGATAGTPTLPRIDSVKGVAPSNLPI